MRLRYELYEDLIFETPEVPKENDIFGYNLPKEKQKWIRPEVPKNF